jgi:hypothetical protein
VAIEANVESVWIAKQPAGRGTPAAAPATNANAKKLRKVGGGISPTSAHGSENYADGKRFQSAADFIDSIVGNGAPVAQMGPGDGAYITYLMCGSETTAAAVATVVPHTIVPGLSSFWFTVWKRVGTSLIVRQKFTDCRMTSLRIEGSSANKVVKLTPTFFSLDAGETFTTDPTTAVDPDLPFLYTEAEGTFTIDGTVIRGHSSFAVVLNDNLATWQGDSVYMQDVTTGAGTVTVENITLLVDAAGKDQYDKIIYGQTSPPTGTKPQKSVYYGAYSFELKRGVAAASSFRNFKVELAMVHWTPDVAIDGNPDGGAVELTLAADARDDGTNPMIKFTVNTLDAAYT